MTNLKIITVFQKLGVLQKGHFQLTSGLHSPEYMQCAKLFEYPKKASQVLQELLPRLPQDIETIIAPAIGGITVGYEMARLLGCRFVFAERQEGQMTFRRGFALSPGERVLAVEDVITTGGSVREVIDLAKEAQAQVLGVASVVDRSQGKANFGVPFVSLITMEIKTYEPDHCPLCAKQVPLNRPGSRQG